MEGARIPHFVCPGDRTPLEAAGEGAGYRCPGCGRSFPVEHGVLCCLEGSDAFYEGRYLNTVRFVPRSERIWWSWPLWLLTCGYVWKVRQHVPAGGVLLEMGCASGVAYFAKRYRVVGLDLSLSSLAQVAEIYDGCIQADVTEGVPLPDGSVDGIVSSFVWEHIPPERKGDALAECARLLKPGGRLVFLYDVESENPTYRAMKRRDLDLYREILIDREGHLGWESPEANRAHFEAAGFRTIESRGREKLLFSPMMYDKVGNWDGWLARAGRLGLRFAQGGRFQAYNAFLRGFDESLGRLLPESWSRVAITVCEAPGSTAR